MDRARGAWDDGAVSPTNRRREILGKLGGRLRRIREDRGLTQEQVAARAGYTSKYVSECERGLRDLPLTTLRAIVEDGLGAGLGDALPDGDGARVPQRAFPRAVVALCREVSALAAPERRAVMAIARAAASLARRR
jgi:transcriptional regulator with XRE-family HTH domain